MREEKRKRREGVGRGRKERDVKEVGNGIA
jgi:hypothetical protein